MKNKELQRSLSEFPDDMEVLIADWQEGYLPPESAFTLNPSFVWDGLVPIDGIVLE